MISLTEPIDLHPRRERSRAIPKSSLHEIHRLVEERGGDTIALHVGEPHIRMPGSVAEAFIRAIRDGHTSYTDAPGLLALREALAEWLAGNGAPTVDTIFVTPGSCQGIAAVLQSIAFEGGVALLPEVHWPIHLQQVLLAGLTPRFFRLTSDAGEIAEVLEEAASPRVCVIIVNSPANPSGVVLSRRMIAAIHAWAVRHRIFVVSDEAYEDFVYAGDAPAMAVCDMALRESERVVFSAHTFSKGFSMTGCRLGYITAPSPTRAELLRRVQEATLVAPSTPVQFAGLAALADPEHLAAHRAYVQATRDEVIGGLRAAKLLSHAPDGGWYALLDMSAYKTDTERLCLDLLDGAGVALAAGHGFLPVGDERGHRLVRLSLCGERQRTLEGVRRLRAYLGRLDSERS
jgi:aspartate/methionine/tyrosine aminotransferase